MSTHYRRDADAIHDRIRMRVKERCEREAGRRWICSFCKKDLGPAGPGFTRDTHGVCPELCPEARAMGWGDV